MSAVSPAAAAAGAPLLQRFLSAPYALAMAPGFFRFYAHIGCLDALAEMGLLNAKEVAGASAGALVAGFLASGKSPKEMAETVFKINREAIWDVGVGLGLLRGGKLQALLERELGSDCQTFASCKIPCGCSTFDILSLQTQAVREGPLAIAMRSSACFPLLFAPVAMNNSLHIDGGVFDHYGLMSLPGVGLSLPGVGPSGVVVNVVFDQQSIQYTGTTPDHLLPPHLRDKGIDLLTVVLSGLPDVNPFTMESQGPLAYRCAKQATLAALERCHVQQLNAHHWVFFVSNGAGAREPSTVSSASPQRRIAVKALTSPRPKKSNFPVIVAAKRKTHKKEKKD